MPDPHLRAADADRSAVATVLGEHMAAGRLTVEEYEDRLSRAYAAKTYGELAELTADLPGAQRAVARSTPRPAPARAHTSGRHHPAAEWRSWAATSVIVTTIWLLTSIGSGGLNYFWPMWVIGPWGAVLLARTLTDGGGRRDRDRPDRRGIDGDGRPPGLPG